MTHKPNEKRRIASLTDLQSAASGRRRSRSRTVHGSRRENRFLIKVGPLPPTTRNQRTTYKSTKNGGWLRRPISGPLPRGTAVVDRSRIRTEKIAFSLKSVLSPPTITARKRTKKPSSSAASAAAHAARPIAYGVLSPLARYWRPLANAESLRLIKTRFVTYTMALSRK
jgi:hypothetical protein